MDIPLGVIFLLVFSNPLQISHEFSRIYSYTSLNIISIIQSNLWATSSSKRRHFFAFLIKKNFLYLRLSAPESSNTVLSMRKFFRFIQWRASLEPWSKYKKWALYSAEYRIPFRVKAAEFILYNFSMESLQASYRLQMSRRSEPWSSMSSVLLSLLKITVACSNGLRFCWLFYVVVIFFVGGGGGISANMWPGHEANILHA